MYIKLVNNERDVHGLNITKECTGTEHYHKLGTDVRLPPYKCKQCKYCTLHTAHTLKTCIIMCTGVHSIKISETGLSIDLNKLKVDI